MSAVELRVTKVKFRAIINCFISITNTTATGGGIFYTIDKLVGRPLLKGRLAVCHWLSLQADNRWSNPGLLLALPICPWARHLNPNCSRRLFFFRVLYGQLARSMAAHDISA